MSHIDHIVIATLLGSVMLGLLVMGVMIMLFRSRARQRRHLLELERLRSEMLSAQNEIREQTMVRLSTEIHDNIGGTLSVAKLQLNAISADNFNERRETCVSLLTRSIQDLRNLSRSLNGNFLAEMGLCKTIEREIGLIDTSGIFHAEMEKSGEPYPIDGQHEVILFRCVQECLNNAVRHSGGDHISLTLNYLPDQIRVSVQDNGKGIDPARPEGIGMRSLRDRMNLLKGYLHIASNTSGTTITLEIPRTAPRL